jgi:ABC-type amino acid transport substrate-binding protein
MVGAAGQVGWPSRKERDQLVRGDEDFLPGGGIAGGDGNCTVRSTLKAEEKEWVEIQRTLELFVSFGRSQGIINAEPGVAQLLNDLKAGDVERRILGKTIGVEYGGGGGEKVAGAEQFGEDDVAHAEAEAGQIDAAMGDEFDEVIVAAAAGDGAELALAVEGLEDGAGVVGEAADDAVIDFDEGTETPGLEVIEDAIAVRAWVGPRR